MHFHPGTTQLKEAPGVHDGQAGGVAAESCPVGNLENWGGTVLQLLYEWEARPGGWETRCQESRCHTSSFTWSDHANQALAIYRRVLNPASGGAWIP